MRIERRDMTPELLAKLVWFDTDTNELRWCWRARMFFDSDTRHAAWNERYANEPAGGTVLVGSKSGVYDKVRTSICICGVTYSVIKVVWCLTRGSWPEGQIVLADGNPCNWTPSNLVKGSAWRRREERQVSFF